MHLLKVILKIIFIAKFINSQLVICDNNECRHAAPLPIDPLLTKLSEIAESYQNTSQILQDLNKRIDYKISFLTAEIQNIQQVIEKQFNKPQKKDYSLYDNLWIVIQRRQDGTVDFYRNWTEYKNGFGNRMGEFFVGLDKIHELTNDRDHELLVILEDFQGNLKYAHYDNFLVGNETERYLLKKLGKYGGSAGDYLRLHLGMFFSTKDSDNDDSDAGNCAEWFKGAWWYYNCMTSNLNGPYRQTSNLTDTERGIGVTWGSYEGIKFSFKSAQMMLRSKKAKSTTEI